MLQYIIQFSIRHRVLVVMLIAFIASVGLFSAQRLPIDAVPDISPNQVIVNTLEVGGGGHLNINYDGGIPTATGGRVFLVE